ncbi:nucleotidyltransferase family protein [Hydrogenovibrio kuenenii]|uniref:nucleotidyltransferase family protein n=1 Tax=Hydrogenovibrio kuenenii TaxID=63658 RepID=UPI0004B6BF6B|nr:nucleotidyltransferase family protein [Hydrogenovibrio kuenenii]
MKDMHMHDWKKIAVSPTSSVKDTLEVMDKTALQIALVISEADNLLGTVTDGDIRRSLLAGATLHTPIEQAMNARPVVGHTHENEMLWVKRMNKHQFRHLPIVDNQQKIVGLFFQKKSVEPISNPVVLMLGGMGTRLRPLTENIPKPMLTVGDQPILETIVKHIAEQGFEEFYFCINYLGDQIRDYFGNGESLGIRIHYIEEKERMGTAGALSLLPELPKKPFIVMNGDLLTKVDLRALIDFHSENENAVTACVREYSQQVPYGVMELNGHEVCQLVEKPVYRYFVNGGIYALSPESLDFVPKETFYDMPSLIDDTLAKSQKVGGFPITEYWMDIGQMPDYYQAQADYEVHFQKRKLS